jgi:hypothetical protein
VRQSIVRQCAQPLAAGSTHYRTPDRLIRLCIAEDRDKRLREIRGGRATRHPGAGCRTRSGLPLQAGSSLTENYFSLRPAPEHRARAPAVPSPETHPP